MAIVTLQPITADDFGLLFEWRNSPASRQFSLNAEPLAWKTHVKWCRIQTSKKLPSVWIALSRDQPVGYGRLDKDGVISVFVSEPCRGYRFSTAIIRALCDIADFRNVQPTATIHDENTVSIAAFASAGFIKHGEPNLGEFSIYTRPDCACEERTDQHVTATSDFARRLGIIETSICRACGAVWLRFVKRVSPWIKQWL